MDMPKSKSVQDAQNELATQNLPKSVKPLSARWKPGINFGEFTNATFAAYH